MLDGAIMVYTNNIGIGKFHNNIYFIDKLISNQ